MTLLQREAGQLCQEERDLSKGGDPYLWHLIDSPEQNRAKVDKLLLPFDMLSDPEGEVTIKPFGFRDGQDEFRSRHWC